MSNLETKETNLNKLIDKLSNLSGTYSQSTSNNEKIKKEKQQLESEKDSTPIIGGETEMNLPV